MPKAAIVSRSEADARIDAHAGQRPRSHSCSFARAARIPGTEGFDRCLKQVSVYRSGAFAFHVMFGDAPGWRLGLVIPKRHVRSAVARNAIKRRWREAFRRQRDAWAHEFGGADFVIRMHAPQAPRPAFDANAMLTTLAERLRSRAAAPRNLPRGAA